MVRVSVIIPTLGRYDDLRRCFVALEEAAALAAGAHDVDAEVVVAADGCDLDVERIPTSLPLRVVRTGTRIGAQAARQLACRSTTTDVLAFLDDDAMPRGDWLQVIAAALSADCAAITGRVLPMESGLLSRARQARYDERYRGLRAGDEVDFFAGGNSAVRADAFHAAGGFGRMGTGGDNSLCEALRSIGGCVRFAPDLVIVHRHDKGLRAATAASISAGLTHRQRLPLRSAVRALASPAPGDTSSVRLLNQALGSAHTLARAVPRDRRCG